MSAKYGAKISQSGQNVISAAHKDLIWSSQFDTLKVLYAGTLTVSLPDETLNNKVKTYTATYTHSLGYIPFFLPHAIQALNQVEPTNSSAVFNVNDANQVAIPAGGFSPALAGEMANVYATTTTLVLEITRFEYAMSPADFGPHNATLDYTLFYNKVNETFNFLA